MAEIKIKSNVALTIRAVQAWDDQMLERAERGLRRGMLGAAAVVQTKYLQGPRPARLGEVTTGLRRSISTRIMRLGDRVMGYVGTNIPYAAFHEVGYHGKITVKAHKRITKLKSGGEEMIFSRRGAVALFKTLKRYQVRDNRGRIVGYKVGLGDKVRGIAAANNIAVSEVEVKAHDRMVDYKGRPFLRPGLADALPVILQEITREVEKAK